MKVLWRSDLGQGKHDPLEVVSVVTKSGSSISADLVVPLDPVLAPIIHEDYPPSAAVPTDEVAGLLEVIDLQMAAVDELGAKVTALENQIDEFPAEPSGLQEWADQFPEMIEDLCMALGFARNPVGPTGIPELDRIVSLAR